MEIICDSFCKKYNGYLGVLPMRIILKAFWYYSQEIYTVCDIILQTSLRDKKEVELNSKISFSVDKEYIKN